MQLPDVPAAAKLPDFGGPRLSPELYAGTVFAKSSYEGRECSGSLVTVFLDPCNHQLRIKPTSSAEHAQVAVIDVHRLQVGGQLHPCTVFALTVTVTVTSCSSF